MNHEIKDRRAKSESPTLVKWVIYGLLAWLFAVIQVGFLSHVAIFGATIEVTFAFILMIGWKKGPVVGGILGMIGGFILDALMGVTISVLPLLFFAAGVYAAFAAKRLFDHPLTYVLMSVPAHVVLAGWRGLCENSMGYALAVLLAGLIGSVVVYIPEGIRYFRGKS